MNNQELIGKKVRGFKFEDKHSIFAYVKGMDLNIGKKGCIKEIDNLNNSVLVEFENDTCYYPLDQIQAHLVEETKEDCKANEPLYKDFFALAVGNTIEDKIEQLAKELFVKEYNFNQDAERISQDSIEAAKEFYNQLNQN